MSNDGRCCAYKKEPFLRGLHNLMLLIDFATLPQTLTLTSLGTPPQTQSRCTEDLLVGGLLIHH